MIICTVTPDGFLELPEEVIQALSLERGKSGQKVQIEWDLKNKTVIISPEGAPKKRQLGAHGSRPNRPRRRGGGSRGVVQPVTAPLDPLPTEPKNARIAPIHRERGKTRFL